MKQGMGMGEARGAKKSDAGSESSPSGHTAESVAAKIRAHHHSGGHKISAAADSALPRAQSLSPTAPGRVRALGLVAGVSLDRDLPIEEIARSIEEPTNLVWVDVQDPGAEELSLLREAFDFHPLTVEDVANGRQRPKVEEYKGYIFVVAHTALAGNELELREIDLFVGRNYVVTVHRGQVSAIDDAMGRWTRGGAMMKEGVGFLLYTVMDAMIDAYFPISEAIGDELDDIESTLFSGFRQDLGQRFLRVKRSLHAMRRVLSPMRETFSVFLRRDHPLFSSATQIYFQDVHDHVLRILDTLDVQRDKVAGSTDAYLLMMSNRMSLLLRTTALASLALSSLAFAFGLWSALGSLQGPATLGAILAAAVVFGVIFGVGARRGWL